MVAGTKMLPVQAGRRRVQHRFDLNLNKADEHQLHEMIRSLKKKRSFLGVIRDGVRLILDLRLGRTEVLQELFPWVLEQAITVTDEIGNQDMLKSQFEELKSLIAQKTSSPAPGPQAAPSSFNVNLDIKEQTISEDNNPTWTFAIKSAAAVYGSYSSITPEVIWYGIRNGHIDAEGALTGGLLTHQQIADGVKAQKLNKNKLPEAVAKEVEKLLGTGGPKKIAGADIEFSEPGFDGIEVDF